MNRRTIVVLTALAAILIFGGGAWLYSRSADTPAPTPAVAEVEGLIRPHSPVMGPDNAPVTIVEFFDPACETCRAFYPIVKEIMARHPGDVRLVLRYAALHQGSDIAVGILEAARRQEKFEPVLEALLAKQPEWASHHAPDLDRAWAIAGEAGLDLARAKQDAVAPIVQIILGQDMEDARTVQLTGTPTFFVNGKPLPSFGPEQLRELVDSEVKAAK